MIISSIALSCAKVVNKTSSQQIRYIEPGLEIETAPEADRWINTSEIDLQTKFYRQDRCRPPLYSRSEGPDASPR